MTQSALRRWLPTPGSHWFQVTGNTVTGLVPGGLYFACPYGWSRQIGGGSTDFIGVRILNSSNNILATTATVYTDWPDGGVPHTAGLLFVAPSNGIVYCHTDAGAATNVTGFRVN